MIKNFQKIIKFSVAFFVFGFIFFGNTNSALAAVRTWTGTTSGLWSVASNWSPGVVPVTGDDLVFPSGASNLSNTNDLTENTIFNSITFTGSGYTLSGNRIILGPGLAGITDSVASGGNTIAFDIRLDTTRDIVVTNQGESLTINGRISGAGGINKEGFGKLILSGANTFGGILKINVGVVNAQNNRALGTILAGTEIVGNAALELQGNIDISYEALALRGYGVSGGGALRNISGNNTYRGLITLSSAGGAEIASDSGTLTLTGGTTGNFPLFFDGAGNITFSTAPLAGSGAITKNGAGTVTLNFPNTHTGAWVINQGTVLYGVNNALLSNAITITGGTLDIATYSDMVGTVTLGTLDLASGTITGTTGVLSSATWTVYSGTISAIISGVAGALTKSTPGTVTLTRDNLYTGATTVSAGILKIQSNNALGVIDGATTVSAGATLEIDGNGLSVPEYITFSGTGHLYTGAIRNKTGNNTITGLMTLGAAAMIMSDSGTTLTVDTKGLSVTNLGLTVGGSGNLTFTSTAPLYGTSGSLIKNDNGILTIQSISNYTGTTTINRGILVLNGAGSIPLSTISINSGGTLTLDNSTTTILNRISDSGALTLRGGNFNFIGNSSSSSQELAGALTLSEGHNIITVTPGAGGSTTMTFASLSRTAGATALFRGTNLGSKPGADNSTIMFNSAPTLTGASGSANSTTISIIKGAFGDTSLSGLGTDMVTYNVGNTNGLRLLSQAGFSGEYASDLNTANANVKLSADTTATTTNTNSLILNGYSVTNPGGSTTLPIASASLAGNILINSATSIAGANTILDITTYELNILATANSTISAVIGTATTGSLTLGGTGNVTISSANPFTGLTSINGATLTYGASNVLSSGGVTVNGGTLNINGSSDTVGAVILQNGTITGGAGILTGTSYSFREGTVSAVIAGSANLGRSTTNTALDSVVTITRNNTYTGVTSITTGILKIGGAGDGVNTPLGTTAGGTTIASNGALDLNGYTLSTSEAITSLAGTGFGTGGSSNMGALMNSSATSVSYSGAITLTAASRINADAGALTISSAIGGNFALTFGGFSDITYSGVRSGTSTIVKDGIGVLTLSGDSSYTGATTISAGTVKLGANGGATNTPLGTTGGATTVALGSRLDLNGFSLGTAEPITLNGVGYGIGNGASGALMNSSMSSATYSGLIALGSASTIKADYGALILSNTGTITDISGLTLGGVGTGILAGSMGAGSGLLTKIDTGDWILSGQNAHTSLINIHNGILRLGANGGGTNTPLGTTGSGTVVFSGASLDLAGYNLGTAEALTINGRGVGNGGALMNSGGAVTFLGSITQGTDSRINNNGSGTLTLSGSVVGAFALYIGGSNNIITAGLGMGGGTLTKQGSGTVTIGSVSTYTGLTRVDEGVLAAGINNALAAPPLEVKGGTFNIATFTDTIGAVTLVGGSISGTTGVLTGTSYTLESGTVSAILAGSVAVTKNTNNEVVLTGVNTSNSATTINAGTLTFSGGGTALLWAITVNLGGTLTLDNSSTAVNHRLSDVLSLTMNGGNFNFIGNGAGASSETVASLTLASGHSVVTITPGSGGSTTVTFGILSRSAGATVLFRGSGLGSTPGANVSTLMFTNPPTLTGAGGSANSTTISIIKGAFGAATGSISDMVTYNVGNSNGLRLLNGAGFSGEYASDLNTANANVKLTANTTATTTNTNSLILNGYSVTNPGGATTLPIASASLAGNILMINGSDFGIAGSNTTLGITTNELVVFANSPVTISATIGTATSGLLTLSGNGNVTLSAQNPYTGYTYINNATLTYGISDVISSGNLAIVGGTLNLSNYNDTVGLVFLTAGIINTGSGTFTLGGQLTTYANANVASIITGNLGLGANRDVNIFDGLMDNDTVISAVISGPFTLSKIINSGVLLLSGNNTYSGVTTVSGGTIRLGATGDGTNTPLGTTAGGTVVSGASSALDLNGYTLGTAEPLTLSGALATGALQNNSSTAVSYSGLITLGAASTIIANDGDINITNSGNITGTYNLTIGGTGNGTLYSNLNTSTGTLTKNGLGVWTLYGGASTFTGLTTISAGTLKLGSAGSGSNTPLGTSAGGVTVTSGAIFDLNGFTLATAEAIGSLSGTGIANKGALINSSNDSVTYSGAITLAAASRVVNYGNGIMTLSGNISGNFALTFVAVGNITQASTSVRSGTSTIIKEGSGTLILEGQNTFTGAVTVSTGVLQLGANGGATNTPLGTNAGGVTVSDGAVLDLNTYSLGGASTYETLNLSGTGIGNGGALISSASGNNNFGIMTLTTNTLIKNNGSGTITFGGTITSANNRNFGIGGTGPVDITGAYGATATSATINKWDSGTLTIYTPSITTGLVRINGGILRYGEINAIATGPVTIAGGTLDLAGYFDTVGTVTLIDGSVIDSIGGGVLTSTATYVLEKGTVSAVLGSAVAAGIAKNTGGKVILSGNNTFTSTSIAVNAGTLNVQHNNALGASGTSLTTTVSAGATLELENSITLPATKAITINGLGFGNGGAVRNISGTNTISANPALGTTNVRINSDLGTLNIPAITGNTFNVVFGGSSSSFWYNPLWSKRVKVTVQSSKVSGTVTDFPVYVNLANLPASFHTNVNQTDARDIRVTTADGTTELAREVVFYDSLTDTGELHFKAPSLSSSSNTDFYIYYGNSSATDYAVSDTYGRNNVWSNGYRSVYHLPNGSSLTAVDSVGVNNATSIVGPTATSGKLDGGANLDGVDDHIVIPDNNSLDLTDNFAISVWFKPDVLNQTNRYLLSKLNNAENDNAYSILWEYVNNQFEFYSSSYTGTNPRTGSGITISDTNFHNIYYNYNGSMWEGYLDGTNTFSTVRTFSLPATTGRMILGNFNLGGSFSADGVIDEVRVSNSARSSGWILTEYNNQNDSAIFYASGTEENYSAGGSIVVSGVIGTTSGNLTKDGAGSVTLSGVNTYTGPTTIIAGVIIANSTSSIGNGSVTNTLIFNGGTLKATGTITSPVNRAVTLAYGGGIIDTNNNDVSIAGTVGNAGGLTKSGAGTLTITGVTTIGRDLTISAGTFVAPTTLTINGDFVNNGTYTHSNGTLIMAPDNTTKTSSILGSSNTTFYNFTNTTTGSTLKFKVGNTYTFSNLLTLTGTDEQRIYIDSDTGSGQWYMNLAGSSSVNYLNVKNSGCAGGNNIPYNATLINLGNNGLCWFYVSYSGGSVGNLEASATPDGQQGAGYVGFFERTSSGARDWYSVASSSDGTKLVAVSFGGYIYTSNDSGVNWTEQTDSGERAWSSVASSSDGTKLAAVVQGGGYIYTSNDSGVNWTEQTNSGQRGWGSIASSSDGTKLVAGTADGSYIYTSNNSGVNWVEQTNSGERAWSSVASSSDGTKLVAGVLDGYIYTSNNSGVNWTEQTNSGQKFWRSVASSSDGTKLVAVVGNSYIYTSNNSGVNWTEQTNSGERNWFSVASSSDGTKLAAVVEDGYIYTSNDSGVNWTEQTDFGQRSWSSVASSYNGQNFIVSAKKEGYLYNFTLDITAGGGDDIEGGGGGAGQGGGGAGGGGGLE